MNIMVTKKGGISTISNGQLLQGIYRNNLQFAYRGNIKEEVIKLSDIKELYEIGDIQSFILKYPKELTSMINKYKKENPEPWLNKVSKFVESTKEEVEVELSGKEKTGMSNSAIKIEEFANATENEEEGK